MTTLDEAKVLNQLERLVASAEISRAPRMSRFLRYVVEKSLASDQAALRERQIGVEVFDRPVDWDPKLDNIVRSEARRLRVRLASYAARNDPDEVVRITMPIGGYSVEFEEREPSQPPLPPPAGLVEAESQRLGSTTTGTGRWWGAAPLALAGVVIAFLYFWHRPQLREAQYKVEPFSSEAGLQFSPAISPNGKEIAFVWDRDSNHYNIYSKTIGSPDLHALTQSLSSDSHPAWSPDGRHLAFLRESEVPIPEVGGEIQLLTLDVGTHQERLIRRMHNELNNWGSSHPLTGCQGLSWERDGDHVVMTEPSGSHGLISMSISTGAQRQITRPAGSDEDCFPKVSSDGQTIAFIRLISHASGYLYTVGVNGRNLHRVVPEAKELRGLDWAHDGKYLVFAAKEQGAYQLRTVSAQGGEPVSVPAATASASDPSVSPNGNSVAFVESHETWNIWRASLGEGEMGTPQRFFASTGKNHSPSYSPDGKKIAFVSDRSGDPEIWLSDENGQHQRQLTRFGCPWLGTIRWSPDGDSIVFDARPNGHSAIYILDFKLGKPLLFEDQPFEVRRPSWSRDGRFVYFDSTRNGVPEVWRRDLRTKNDQAIATAGFMLGIESPDGKHLFYQEHEGRHIWVSDHDGGRPRQLPKVQPLPDLDWVPIGHFIYFASASADGADLLSYDLDNDSLRTLGHIKQNLAAGTPSFSVSPDGKYLLYATIDSSSSEIKLRTGPLPR